MADSLIAQPGAQAGNSAAAPAPSTVWIWAPVSAVVVLALMAPALWNGLPLVFSDTGGYLTRPTEGALAMGRSALYGLFLYLSVPLAFWPVVIVQAAAMAWLIVLILRVHGLGGRPWLALAVTALLALGTSLPWFASQLMPDILFPAAVLALHLLAFNSDHLSRRERLGLVTLIAVAIASHMAALGLCIGLLAAFWLLARVRFFALPKQRLEPRLGYAAAAAGAGIALCLISNLAITGSFAFTPGGASFLFGRLIEDGIVARYLGERCPDASLHICAYYRDLPNTTDDWLWGNDTAFYKLGGWAGFGDEAMRIIRDSIVRYPLMHLNAAIAATVEQFVRFATEISIHDNGPTIDSIRDHTPQLLGSVLSARQHAAPLDLSPLNWLHVPVAALSMAALAGALVFRDRLALAPRLAALGLTVLVALAINAAVCGVFSHPVDRYQSRLVPLAAFAVALAIAGRRRAYRLGRPVDLA